MHCLQDAAAGRPAHLSVLPVRGGGQRRRVQDGARAGERPGPRHGAHRRAGGHQSLAGALAHERDNGHRAIRLHHRVLTLPPQARCGAAGAGVNTRLGQQGERAGEPRAPKGDHRAARCCVLARRAKTCAVSARAAVQSALAAFSMLEPREPRPPARPSSEPAPCPHAEAAAAFTHCESSALSIQYADQQCQACTHSIVSQDAHGAQAPTQPLRWAAARAGGAARAAQGHPEPNWLMRLSHSEAQCSRHSTGRSSTFTTQKALLAAGREGGGQRAG